MLSCDALEAMLNVPPVTVDALSSVFGSNWRDSRPTEKILVFAVVAAASAVSGLTVEPTSRPSERSTIDATVTPELTISCCAAWIAS